MLNKTSPGFKFGFQILAVVGALIFTTLIMLLAKAPPLEAFRLIVVGSVGSVGKISDVIVAWIPLLLATTGLLLTFAAGLWNIGIEGQITLGAIFTTWALRLLQDSSLSPGLIIIIGFMAGVLGGMLWASLTGLLKIYGGVNEIFGGLGLNFVATALTIWLIFGPWKRPGVGSMSGTVPFDNSLWLPQVEGLRMSWWSLGIGLIGIAIVYLILQGTYFGLRLKAVGKNGRAAFVIGIPTGKYMMSAFFICGAFAGLAGAVQVLAVYHRLIPSISSGYGFLGLMVAMLINYQALWAAPVAFFFAALNIGSIQLPIVLKLDSALSGVLQGSLVLFVLMMDGVRRRLTAKKVK
ncbi:MAG TPA: ABC transporter permease [Bellilinea sp.]